MVIAVLAYVASHFLRYGRIRVLFQEHPPTDARLVDAHITSAWIGAILPFRLGEAVRVARFIAVAGRWRVGVAAYAMEKFFDAIVLLGVAALAMLSRPSAKLLLPLATLLAVVVGGGLVAYAVADSLIDSAARRLLFAGSSPRTLWQLRGVAQARQLFAAVRSTVRQRGSLLLLLTASIWLLDGFAFAQLVGPVATSRASEWAAFLATLQRMLGSTPGAAGGRYTTMVITVLSIAAAGCSILWVRRHLPSLWNRGKLRQPYRLVTHPLVAPDE